MSSVSKVWIEYLGVDCEVVFDNEVNYIEVLEILVGGEDISAIVYEVPGGIKAVEELVYKALEEIAYNNKFDAAESRWLSDKAG